VWLLTDEALWRGRLISRLAWRGVCVLYLIYTMQRQGPWSLAQGLMSQSYMSHCKPPPHVATCSEPLLRSVVACRELLLLIDTRLRSLLRVTTCCESLVHLLLVVTTLGPLLLVVTHREHPLCAAMRREPLYIARLYCSSHPV
jgi:hypothetical protein